jgi:pyridinium-3,5-biscarboxylic acid mononucleotide synthase
VSDPDFIADLEREARTGFPEVIFGQGKTPEQVAMIGARILEVSRRLLVTRASADQHAALAAAHPGATWHARARAVTVGHDATPRRGCVSVVCAGTTDVPVAEEAALTAEMWGAEVVRLYDVGVAGLHRLLERRELLRDCRAHVVVAGMDGALASVLGGLVGEPVIAVPTSVGYGAAFGGLAPLLAMLSSCAPGVTVVNIDNGFGAGFAAGRLNASFERLLARRDGA